MTGIILTVQLAALSAFAPAPVPEGFVTQFHEKYPRNEDRVPLEQYASIARFDSMFMGDRLDEIIASTPDNEGGKLPWSYSYHMMGYVEMAKATGDERYLEAARRLIEKILSLRDDQRGVAVDVPGVVRPTWGSARKSDRVDTPARYMSYLTDGMLLYPMLDFVYVTRTRPEYRETHQKAIERIRSMALETIAIHEGEWRDGPESGAGYYVWRYPDKNGEFHRAPFNWLSSIGRCHWMAYKVTGREHYRNRAIRIGRYIKPRLAITVSGAYDWPYALSYEPMPKGATMAAYSEDISHAALSITLPILLGAEGLVFDATDLSRFGKTVTEEFGRYGDGVMCPDLRCREGLGPGDTSALSRWMRLTPWCPEVYPCIARFYLNYEDLPKLIDLALMIRYGDVYRRLKEKKAD